MTNEHTRDLVHAYYDCWTRGAGSYDPTRLRTLLAPTLVFEGPIGGRHEGVEAFLPGLAKFVQTLKARRVVQEMVQGSEAAVLYDSDVTAPAGTVRFAEFFHVEAGVIRSIRLVFDATEFRKQVAR